MTLRFDTRYIAPGALTSGGIIAPALCVADFDGYQTVSHAGEETSSTVELGYAVAMLDASLLTEFLVDDIYSILGSNDYAGALKKLDELFRSSSLYSPEGSRGGVLVLLSPTRVEPIFHR